MPLPPQQREKGRWGHSCRLVSPRSCILTNWLSLSSRCIGPEDAVSDRVYSSQAISCLLLLYAANLADHLSYRNTPTRCREPFESTHTGRAGFSLGLQRAASQPFSFSKTKRSIGVFLISSYYSCYCTVPSFKAHG